MRLPLGLFVAVGHNACRIVSTDGTTWTNQQTGKEGEIFRQVAFGNGHFATVGSYGGDNIVSATKDGATWVSSKKDARYAYYIRGLSPDDAAQAAARDYAATHRPEWVPKGRR